MNPITSFLVFVSLGVGAALAYWINPFLGLPFIALAVIIGVSLNVPVIDHVTAERRS